MVEAFAAGDAAAVFGIVDQVVEAGHDPRRFAEDLLERLRDLIIIDAVPEAAGAILGEHPADELDRMRQQAAHFGAAELSRAADIVNAGLTEMRGATAPRLQLELICARVLLPAAEDTERGVAARLDRLERRADIAGAPATATAPADRHPPSYAGHGARPRPRPPAARPRRRRPRPPRPRRGTGRRARPPRRRPRSRQPEPAAAPPPSPASRRPSRRRAAAGRRRDRRPGDRAPALAGGARGGQDAAPLHLDAAQPERPGRRRWTTAGITLAMVNAGAAGQLPARRQRRDRPRGAGPGARRRLEGRRDRRPVDRPHARRRPAAPADPERRPSGRAAAEAAVAAAGRGRARRARGRGRALGRRRRRRRQRR